MYQQLLGLSSIRLYCDDFKAVKGLIFHQAVVDGGRAAILLPLGKKLEL